MQYLFLSYIWSTVIVFFNKDEIKSSIVNINLVVIKKILGGNMRRYCMISGCNLQKTLTL